MRISLTGGAYQARSVIANAQRCINLYQEPNQEDAPVKFTHYPTPGLTMLSQPTAGASRGIYTASNGSVYRIVGNNVYYVDSTYIHHLLGVITTSSGMCTFADNGLVILVVDGSTKGYCINMTSNAFSTINDTNFLGGVNVQYIDTFFVLNQPGTANWYSSLAEITYAMCIAIGAGTAFNALYITAKSGYSDPLATLIVMHQEIWLMGTLTCEIWYNAGNANFPFAQVPQGFINHGCAAPYSVCTQDTIVYWLSKDLQGQTIVLRGAAYTAERISTHAIEAALSSYSTIGDAIGYIYQQQGHTFYVLNFPAANVTWVYDESCKLWHQRAYTDANGNLNRHLVNCVANAYGIILACDYANGNLYTYDLNNYTDNGNSISRIRSFPHLLDDSKRIVYDKFIADMDVGQDSGVDGTNAANPPQVALRWSDTKGVTYGNAVYQSLGAGGQYGANIQFRRLGLGRDRVFELSWSMNASTALNGAFVETTECAT